MGPKLGLGYGGTDARRIDFVGQFCYFRASSCLGKHRYRCFCESVFGMGITFKSELPVTKWGHTLLEDQGLAIQLGQLFLHHCSLQGFVEHFGSTQSSSPYLLLCGKAP